MPGPSRRSARHCSSRASLRRTGGQGHGHGKDRLSAPHAPCHWPSNVAGEGLVVAPAGPLTVLGGVPFAVDPVGNFKPIQNRIDTSGMGGHIERPAPGAHGGRTGRSSPRRHPLRHGAA